MPLVSVIVPVYNVESKLCRCIDSILNQSFTDFELLLIDDGSCDKSGEICEDYRDKDYRIKVFHQKNKGVSSARNAGINVASGKYICFVDSDDYIEEQYLEVLFRGIKNCQLSVCGVYYCREDTNLKTSQKSYDDFDFNLSDKNFELLADLIRNGRFNYVYSKMYIKSVIMDHNILFDEKLSLGEDTVFVFDYIKCIEKVCVIGGSYYNYIKCQKNTLTTVFRDKIYDSYIFINNKIEQSLNEMNYLNDITLRAIDERRIQAILITIETIMLNGGLSAERKVYYLETICKNDNVILYLDRNKDLATSDKLLKVVKSQSARRVYQYYLFSMKKERYVLAIKKTAVYLLPKNFIKKVKTWFRIAQ